MVQDERGTLEHEKQIYDLGELISTEDNRAIGSLQSLPPLLR